jgi:hypothetical protein
MRLRHMSALIVDLRTKKGEEVAFREMAVTTSTVRLNKRVFEDTLCLLIIASCLQHLRPLA